MRTIFAIFALCALAYAAESEDMFLQADSAISEMKKKGATNADCVDLANTMCKTVENEVSTDQKLINRLKDGRQCLHLGLKGVRSATARLKKTRSIAHSWKVKVTKSYHHRVNMGVHTFSSLKQGKCANFFTSRSYRVAKHTYTRNVKIEASWRGRVKEAIKVLVQFKRARARQVKVCHCATRRARNVLWRTVTKRSRLSRQVKAHQKCKMMGCILKGTSLRSRKCRASLKRLVNKKLISATETVKNCANTKGTFSHKKKVKREKLLRKAEKDRKKRAREGAQKRFKEKNAKGRERAAKRKERATKAEKKNKERKKKVAEATQKRNKRLAAERKNKERNAKRRTWQLAMVINGKTTTFDYNSAHWTNGRTGNFGSGNKKTHWFNKRAREIRIIMKNGRNTRSITYRHNTNLSLTQLFKGGFRRTTIPVNSWRHLGGNNKFGFQNHCNRQGFNNYLNKGMLGAWGNNFQKTDSRFGITMNQENNCGSPDSSIGIGMKSAGISAGGNCRCCNNGGSCKRIGATAYVYVKQA